MYKRYNIAIFSLKLKLSAAWPKIFDVSPKLRLNENIWHGVYLNFIRIWNPSRQIVSGGSFDTSRDIHCFDFENTLSSEKGSERFTKINGIC
jgi:hypothetical protein